MIYSLNGVLIHKELGFAVVECGGVGFKVFISFSTFSALPEQGQNVRMFTHMNVREDAMDLYGFNDIEEQNCFKMLIGVSGVGPKMALAILSEMNAQKFALNIATGDYKAFTKASGVGAKTAQRIVLELKDKISKETVAADFKASDDSPDLAQGDALGEALSALMVLGYTQGESAGALKKVNSAGLSTEQIIKEALKQLMKW